MKNIFLKLFSIPFLFFLLAIYSNANKTFAQQIEGSVSQLKLIGISIVPTKKQFKGTTIGGLSSIDYDIKRDVYYLISDDRSEFNPARYYTAKIHFKETGIDSVEFIDVTTLLTKEGKLYPNSSQDASHTPDPEALRYDPQKDEMVWSSEGERGMRNGKMILEDPAITVINRNGFYKDSFALPSNMRMHSEEKGPRQNSVFEGVSFADSFKYVYVSVEEPIYEDGPRASTNDSTAWTRILKFDDDTKKQIAQYAYQLDAIPYPANPPNAYKINGISDILYIGNDKLLVLERAYSSGRIGCNIKLYSGDLKNVTDVADNISLKTQPSKNPIRKTLILNFDTLGKYIDNVEGMTFGPTLPNGHRTMLFVVDDNFSKLEEMQFFVFEVVP